MLSYLIVVAAAVLFFAVCYWFISRSHAEETAASAAAPVPSNKKKRERLNKNQEEDASPARKTVSEATQVFTSPLSRISDEEDGGEEKTRILQNQSWNIPDQSRQLIKTSRGRRTGTGYFGR